MNVQQQFEQIAGEKIDRTLDIKIDGDTVTLYRKAEDPETIKRLLSQNQALLSTARLAYMLMIEGSDNPKMLAQIGNELKEIINHIEQNEA